MTSRPARTPVALMRSAAAGVGAIIVMVAVLAGLSIYQSRLRHDEQVAVTTQNLASSLEQSLGGTIDKTDLSLRAAQMLAESQLVRGSIDGKSLNAFLAHQQSLMPELEALRVADVDGVVRFGEGVPVAPAVSLADRDYFVRVRDDAGAGLVIDGPVLSRFSGKWVMVFARRINRPGGSFGGMVYAIIAAEHFRRLFSSIDLGMRGALTLRTADLRLVARYPGAQQGGAVGSSNVSPQLAAAIRAAPRAGNYAAVTALDNIERQNAYRKVAGYPFYIIVGMATDDYLADWRREAVKIVALAVLVMLVVLAASLLVWWSWRLQTIARDAFAAESRRNRQFLRNASDGVHILDDRGNLMELSDSFAAMLGYSREELLGRNVRDWDAKWNDADLQGIIARQLSGGGHALFETRHRRRDGSIIDVEVTGHPLELDGKRVLFNSSRDITQRKRADAERRHFAAIVANSNDAIVSRALDGTVMSWNPAAEKLFGYTAAEAIGREMMEIFPSGQVPEIKANREMISLDSAVPSYNTVRIAKDGRRLNLSLSVFPLKDSDGIVIGMSAIVRDNSEREKGTEARARLAAIVENSSDAIIGRDVDGKIVTWNAAAERMYGYTAAEAIGQPPYMLNPPELRESVALRREQVRAGKAVVSYETVGITKDGRRIDVSLSVLPVLDEKGNVAGTASIARDITERKRIEEAHSRLAAIVESSQDAIISRSLDGTILSWNAGAEHLFGYTAAEAVGRKTSMLIPADRIQYYERNQQLLREGHIQPPYEGVNVTKDGRHIPVSISISPVRAADGTITHAATVVRDITAAKEAEAQLRLAAGVFDTAAEGIMVTDRHNKVIAVNAAFTQITGYEASDVVGKYPRLHYAGRRAQRTWDAMLAEVAATGHWQGEVWDRRKSGEAYCELLSVSVVRNEAGEVVRHCVILMDITRRKIAEEELTRLNDELERRVGERTRELERANKELDAFSYSVSHDLRAPLRAVSGFSALVMQEQAKKLDAPTRDYLEKIRAGAERMGRLIDDLLRLSRISRQQMRRQDFDLTQMANEVVAVVREQSPQRAAQVMVAPNLRANGDRGLMRIALDNLIGNAWKFTARNAQTQIDIGCTERDGEAVYFVRDNGAGFDMQYAGKLFSAFQRLHSSAEFEGTGIGLSVVQRIITRHGGAIWAEGKPGAGATFYFTLGRPEDAAKKAVSRSAGAAGYQRPAGRRAV